MMLQKMMLLSAFLLFQSTSGITQSCTEKADELLVKFVSEKIVVGVAAGYTQEGELIWNSALGYSNDKIKEKFKLNTVTRIASIAKPMTAIAVMQLVEKGLIDLDKPIQTYISDYPVKEEGGITVRHLLSHTSGIPGYANTKEAQNQKFYPSMAQAVEVFKDRKLLFGPGSAFSYTTYGYVVLGLIIEKVSGLTFEKYMQENIWEKADMINTGVEKAGMDVIGKSELYHRSKNGKIKPGKPNDLSNRIPGGGFYSTLNDLLNFGNAILNHTLVSKSTYEEMTRVHSIEKVGNPYGFGWFLYAPEPNRSAIFGHTGEQTGVSAQLMLVPGSKTVIVVLANTSGSLREVFNLADDLIGLSEERK